MIVQLDDDCTGVVDTATLNLLKPVVRSVTEVPNGSPTDESIDFSNGPSRWRWVIGWISCWYCYFSSGLSDHSSQCLVAAGMPSANSKELFVIIPIDAGGQSQAIVGMTSCADGSTVAEDLSVRFFSVNCCNWLVYCWIKLFMTFT